jgi:hypothetical protein
MIRLADRHLCLVYGLRATLSEDDGKTWDEQIGLRDDAGCHALGYLHVTLRAEMMPPMENATWRRHCGNLDPSPPSIVPQA